MISSLSSSLCPKRAGKTPGQHKPASISKRAIIALLATGVKAESSPITGVSTTALDGGGFVVTWSKLDGSIASRPITVGPHGDFVQNDVLAIVPKEDHTEPIQFPGHLISGQITPAALPDQIPVDKLPTIPDSKLETVSAAKLRGTIPIETLPVIPDEKLASLSSDKLNGTLPLQALPAAALYHNPIGSVIHYPTDTVPEDYLECNGQTVLRDDYPALFSTIGVTYGPGDSVSTFRLPDYRGQFLRGWNHGSNVDTDCDVRTDRGDGTTGDAVGTRQTDEFRSHSHNFRQSTSYGNNRWSPVESDRIPMGVGPNWPDTRTASGVIYNSGGSETRPKNIAVMYIIRAK